MSSVRRLSSAFRGPRRIRLDEGVLVLPPVSLRDLPPGGTVGLFKEVAALRFSTPAGVIAVFLHDLDNPDMAQILEAQRREAEAQLGERYAHTALWWERP